MNINFNSDLNILTGRNGSGKTKILKIVWRLISGNIETAIEEVSFDRVKVITTKNEILLYKKKYQTLKLEVKKLKSLEKVHKFYFDVDDGPFPSREMFIKLEMFTRNSGSIFFLLFVGLKGGFSIRSRSNFRSTRPRRFLKMNSIEEALNSLSNALSNNEHEFIATISTSDIVEMLLQKYTNLTDEVKKSQNAMSTEIISSIKDYQRKKMIRNQQKIVRRDS